MKNIFVFALVSLLAVACNNAEEAVVEETVVDTTIVDETVADTTVVVEAVEGEEAIAE
jgi:hypothetical protein